VIYLQAKRKVIYHVPFRLGKVIPWPGIVKIQIHVFAFDVTDRAKIISNSITLFHKLLPENGLSYLFVSPNFTSFHTQCYTYWHTAGYKAATCTEKGYTKIH